MNLLEAAGLLYSGPAYTRHPDGDLRVSDRYREAAQLVSSALLDVIGRCDEPPNEPGWYWWREQKVWEMVRVYFEPEWFNAITGDFEPRLVVDDGSDCHEPVSSRGQWAGPIPEPVEAK